MSAPMSPKRAAYWAAQDAEKASAAARLAAELAAKWLREMAGAVAPCFTVPKTVEAARRLMAAAGIGAKEIARSCGWSGDAQDCDAVEKGLAAAEPAFIGNAISAALSRKEGSAAARAAGWYGMGASEQRLAIAARTAVERSTVQRSYLGVLPEVTAALDLVRDQMPSAFEPLKSAVEQASEEWVACTRSRDSVSAATPYHASEDGPWAKH